MFIAFTHPQDHQPRLREVKTFREAAEVIQALQEMGVEPNVTSIDAIHTASATALPLIVNPWNPNDIKLIH